MRGPAPSIVAQRVTPPPPSISRAAAAKAARPLSLPPKYPSKAVDAISRPPRAISAPREVTHISAYDTYFYVFVHISLRFILSLFII